MTDSFFDAVDIFLRPQIEVTLTARGDVLERTVTDYGVDEHDGSEIFYLDPPTEYEDPEETGDDSDPW